MSVPLNPFSDEGIANFEQFKAYPYIVVNAMETIKNKIEQEITQIKNGYFFGSRILLIGSRGIGKTSALFFIKDRLDKARINNFVFSHLIQDAEHFKVFTGVSLEEATKEAVYFLIDFPDRIDPEHYKKFLNFLWNLITHKNYSKINLIFALNHSHYNKSFDYSEILGKFTSLRLEQFNLENTKKLIESRLDLIKIKQEQFIEPKVLDLIYAHTNGVPRNIISACNLLFSSFKGKPLQYECTSQLIQEKYFDQILNDRVEDRTIREVYRLMVEVLKNDFNGNCDAKLDYINKVKIITNLGYMTISKKIEDLKKFGIIIEKRTGDKRTSKSISFG